MQYKQTTKIIIDKRKLDILIRLGCSETVLLDRIKSGKFVKTGDDLIDENLETLLDVKSFKNWGGKRANSGNKKKNQFQVENHLDNQVENQDASHLADKDIDKEKDKDRDIFSRKFKKPSFEEVEQYCKERNNHIDPNKWYDYYTANGWKVGRNPMKDWKATVRTWERKNKTEAKEQTVYVEEGKFYIDPDATEYKDLFESVADKQKLANDVWDWIYKNFAYQEVKISFIRSMIGKFKQGG